MYISLRQRAENLAVNSVHFSFFFFGFVLLLARAGVMTDSFFFCLEKFIKFHLLLSHRMRVGKKESICQPVWGKFLQTVVRILFPWKIIKSYAT